MARRTMRALDPDFAAGGFFAACGQVARNRQSAEEDLGRRKRSNPGGANSGNEHHTALLSSKVLRIVGFNGVEVDELSLDEALKGFQPIALPGSFFLLGGGGRIILKRVNPKYTMC